MIRVVVIEDEPLAGQRMAALLDDTWQVEVIGTATDGVEGLRLCAELRPDAAFLDINLPSKEDVSLATQLTRLAQPPRLVLMANNTEYAAGAFRLEAVDYLLKPLDPLQVAEAVDRLLTWLRPFQYASADRTGGVLAPGSIGFTDTINELLPVSGVDRDEIRLLSRREVVAVLRRDRRTWVHTVLEEFATYYPLAELMLWLGGDPFVQVGRHAVVNLRAAEHIIRCGDRFYRVSLHDRLGSEITTSRSGAARLSAALKTWR
jgi:DNA-binding LytR/AlgR family response regulator